MDNSLRSIIDSAKEILVLLPQNPSFDAVAAGLSLYLSIKGEKSAYISSSSPVTVEFNRLVGVNKIKSELGGKNLTIKLVDYPAKNVEKVSYDIIDEEFRLMVVPKDGLTPPSEDQVYLSYSGVSADTVFVMGGQSEADFPALSSDELKDVKIVHIGVNEITSSNSNAMSFARPASSISELTASLIKETGLSLDADIATNLFSGMQKATNGLTSQSVDADTYELAAYLLRAGAQRQSSESQPANYPAGSVPGHFMSPARQEPRSIEETEKAPRPGEAKAPGDWLKPKIYKSGNDTSIS